MLTVLLVLTAKAFAGGGCCTGSGSCSGQGCSCGMMQSANNQQYASAKSTEKSVEKKEVGNKICPISGEEVGGMGEVVQYEYKGKIYNLCCPMCEKDFKKDPEAAIKRLEMLEKKKM